MSKLKSFRKLVVRPCDHTEQEYLDYCHFLERVGVIWQGGEKPQEFNFPPRPDRVVILDTVYMTLSIGNPDNPDPERHTTSIQYAMFLLEDHLYEQT